MVRNFWFVLLHQDDIHACVLETSSFVIIIIVHSLYVKQPKQMIIFSGSPTYPLFFLVKFSKKIPKEKGWHVVKIPVIQGHPWQDLTNQITVRNKSYIITQTKLTDM